MAARVTLKAVNDELARLGYGARLARGSGYFYFQFGEAADWLDRSVPAVKIGSHSLDEWIAEFGRLKDLNQRIMQSRYANEDGGRGCRRRMDFHEEDHRKILGRRLEENDSRGRGNNGLLR